MEQQQQQQQQPLKLSNDANTSSHNKGHRSNTSSPVTIATDASAEDLDKGREDDEEMATVTLLSTSSTATNGTPTIRRV
jgi:hypothetical protein